MKRSLMKHRTLPLAMTALAAVPMAGVWWSTPAAAATTKAAKTQTFKGAMESVDHGPVQVSITVKNKKITGVQVANSPENARSVVIQGQAIPILKAETLRAQSARINEVSGATDTSGGYIAALQSAINKAKQARALK